MQILLLKALQGRFRLSVSVLYPPAFLSLLFNRSLPGVEAGTASRRMLTTAACSFFCPSLGLELLQRPVLGILLVFACMPGENSPAQYNPEQGYEGLVLLTQLVRSHRVLGATTLLFMLQSSPEAQGGKCSHLH